MLRLTRISDSSFSVLTKDLNKDIKDSKHSPVYRKRGAEGFSPLFCFLFVYLNKMKRNMKVSPLIYLKQKVRLVKIFLLLLGFTLIPTISHAQVKGIISYVDWDEDNAIMGDSTNLYVFTKFISATTNADTTVFGNVFFRYKTNWMALYNPNWIETLDNYLGWETINPGLNQFNLRFYCNPDPNVMRTGPVNVIIIWPAFFNPSNPLIDSADYFLPNADVSPYVGLMDEEANQFGSTVYPNPAMSTQIVFINSKYSQQIEKISIINAMGQALSSKEFIDGEDSKGYVLPTEELRSGIYHIQIFYKDKKTEVVKFIKN